MILIADSGSTKTDWCIVFNDTPIKRIGTKRNQSLLPIRRRNSTRADTFPLPQLPEGTINSVFFYGAGCTPERAPVLRRAIADSLPVIGNIKTNSDMLPLPADYADMKLGLPASSAQVPILVSTTAKRLSTTSPL